MEKSNEIQSIKLSYTNCYFLKCNEGYLLIDTSYPKDYEKFEKKIKKIKINLTDIKYLFLTHHHDDHAGFATKLVEKTGAKIIVHKNALSYLEQGKPEEDALPINKRVKFTFKLFERFHEFGYPPVRLSEEDIILDSDNHELLKTLGIDGAILYTPGHTSDHLAIVLANGNAFVGDVAMNFLKFTGIKKRPIFAQDINTVFESWQKIIDHGAKTIYPAHGKPFDVKALIASKEKFAKS